MLPPSTSLGFTLAGTVVNGNFDPRIICYVVPIGTDNYVKYMMNQKVDEVARRAENSCKVLGGEKQSLWTVLRLSMSQQLDYWLQLCYPSHVLAAANRMD